MSIHTLTQSLTPTHPPTHSSMCTDTRYANTQRQGRLQTPPPKKPPGPLLAHRQRAPHLKCTRVRRRPPVAAEGPTTGPLPRASPPGPTGDGVVPNNTEAGWGREGQLAMLMVSTCRAAQTTAAAAERVGWGGGGGQTAEGSSSDSRRSTWRPFVTTYSAVGHTWST